MTTTTKIPSRRTRRTSPRLAQPHHERLAELFTHWAKMAQAGQITGLCYVILFDDGIGSGFGEQFWENPGLALPELEKLWRSMLVQRDWLTQNPGILD